MLVDFDTKWGRGRENKKKTVTQARRRIAYLNGILWGQEDNKFKFTKSNTYKTVKSRIYLRRSANMSNHRDVVNKGNSKKWKHMYSEEYWGIPLKDRVQN